MINTSTLGAAAVARIAQAGATYIGKLGPLFFVVLQSLYAAHVERVQMRFAPTPVYPSRVIERRDLLRS
jgi:hypothetical protein